MASDLREAPSPPPGTQEKRPKEKETQTDCPDARSEKQTAAPQCNATAPLVKNDSAHTHMHTHTTVRPPPAAAACCRGPRGGRHKPCRSHRRVYGEVFLYCRLYVCVCASVYCVDVYPAGLQIPRPGDEISFPQEHQTMMLACRSSSSSSDSDSGRGPDSSVPWPEKAIRQRSKIERHHEGQTYIHTYRTWGTNTYKTT